MIVGNDPSLQNIILPPKDLKVPFFQSYWTSPEALSEVVAKYDPSKAWLPQSWKQEKQFTGVENMAEAISLAQNGWTEGVDKIERIASAINLKNPLQLKTIEYNIAGSNPNIPRALAGDPMHMRVPDLRKASRRPVLTLVSDMAVAWTVDQKALVNRAAVVAAIVDRTEVAGYSLDILSVADTIPTFWSGSSVELYSRVALQLKNSNQHLDLARVAYGLGHPAMFRYLVFAEWSYHKFNEGLGDSLGHNVELKRDRLAPNCFIIPKADNANFGSEENARTIGYELILEHLKAQNFPLI